MSGSARRPKINASENRKFMWEREIRNSCRHQLPSPARTAAYVLATHMNPEGECFIGAARLAKGMGVSERTAKRAKRQLKGLGWVLIQNEGERKADGSYATTIYRANDASPCRICHQEVTPVTPGSDNLSPGSDNLSPGSDTGVTRVVSRLSPGSDTGGPITDQEQIWPKAHQPRTDSVTGPSRSLTDSLSGGASPASLLPSQSFDWKDQCGTHRPIKLRRGMKAARIAGKAHEDHTPSVPSPVSTVSSQDRKRNGAAASQDKKIYGSSRLERRSKVGGPLSPGAKAAEEESRQTNRAAWAEVMAQL
jgi:hypothetical protein